MLQFVFSDNEEKCNWITFVILKEQIQAKKWNIWRQMKTNMF